MSDDQKQPSAPNEVAELRAKVDELQDRLDYIGFINTVLAICLKDILNGRKIDPKHIEFLNNNDFEVFYDEE